MPTLHVVIPVYNERGTLDECIKRVFAAPLPQGWNLDVTLVDDCSDASHFPAVEALACRLKSEGKPLTFLRHPVNRGKGAALQTGFDAVLNHNPPADDRDVATRGLVECVRVTRRKQLREAVDVAQRRAQIVRHRV